MAMRAIARQHMTVLRLHRVTVTGQELVHTDVRGAATVSRDGRGAAAAGVR